MRIAVVGAGRIGALHARTLAALPAVEQLLVADSDAVRATALAQELGAVALPDVDAVWAARPDGVVVGSPTATHAPLVHAALDAGIGVLCEKPLTLSLSESSEIAARAREAETVVMVGFPRRFDVAFGALRDDIAHARHGTPYLLHIRHAEKAPPPPGYLATSGSLFVDMCIHDYDAIRWLAGCEVEAVSATGARLLEGFPEIERYGDVDTALTTLQLANGALATIEAYRQAPSGYEATAELVTPARIVSTASARWSGGGATWQERFADAFRSEIEAFLDVLAGARANPCTADDAHAALRIALAAERSFAEGRVVRVAEIDQTPEELTHR